MDWIALTGPMCSGKSTFARFLCDNYDFQMIDYTGYLKDLAATGLRAMGYPVSRQEIEHDKVRYRPFLQDLGTLVGYDDGAYIDQLVLGTIADTEKPERLVFDCVRSPFQWEKLKMYGFRLMRIQVAEHQWYYNMKQSGVTQADFVHVSKHATEQGLPSDYPDAETFNLSTYHNFFLAADALISDNKSHLAA